MSLDSFKTAVRSWRSLFLTKLFLVINFFITAISSLSDLFLRAPGKLNILSHYSYFISIWLIPQSPRKAKYPFSLKSLKIQLLADASKLSQFVSILSFRERNICLFSSSQSTTITRTVLLIHFELFAVHLLHDLTERKYTYLLIVNARYAQLFTLKIILAIWITHLFTFDYQMV